MLTSLWKKMKGFVRPRYCKRYYSHFIKMHRTAEVHYERNLHIGKYSYIGPNCYLNAEGGITIGEGTIFAPCVVVLSSSHDYKNGGMLPYDIYDVHRKVIIGRGVWIGYGAMICPGVTIGDGAVIAMGSVVTKDIGKGEIVGGNPARTIGTRPEKEVEDNIAEERYFHRIYWKRERLRKVSQRK
ncbi:MAG: acyltransferase [Candidatus Aureabacteria bacterium]|nr:acyltransferase [Candidatus Auribacterota bacterium]